MKLLRTTFWLMLLVSALLILLITKVFENIERFDMVFAFYLLLGLMAAMERISKKLTQ